LFKPNSVDDECHSHRYIVDRTV